MKKEVFIREYIGHSKSSILERLHEAIGTIEELREYLAQSDTLHYKVRIQELTARIGELEEKNQEFFERNVEYLKSGNKDMAHLYNELNTIKWWGAEKGDAWDSCVDAVRDFIKKEYLPKDSK